MNTVQDSIASTEYSPDPPQIPNRPVAGLDRLVGLAQNAGNSLPVKNDAIEFVGDAFVNYGTLQVITKSLDSVTYDDAKLFGCVQYLYLKFTSNDILSRIECKTPANAKGERVLTNSHKGETKRWLAARQETRAPKVYADIFEANAWLITMLLGTTALFDRLSELFLPLLPSALLMFEQEYESASRPENFAHMSRCHRDGFASGVDPDQARVLCGIVESASEEFVAMMSLFKGVLSDQQLDSIQFDNRGFIQGRYKHLHLLGHTALKYYIAKALDMFFPTLRCGAKGISHFQTIISGLNPSRPSFQGDSTQIIARRGAGIFLSSIGILSLRDPEGLEKTLDHMGPRLITTAHNVLLRFNVPFPSVVVPCDPNYVNRIPLVSEGAEVKRAIQANTWPPPPPGSRTSSKPAKATAKSKKHGSAASTPQNRNRNYNDTPQPSSSSVRLEDIGASTFTFRYPRKQ
ncbi:hypothetical protein EYR40_010426 [Pleurotus pulmonarius]|nr:hypothetical protein EYR36_010187 [Pleurotus pulmonarius]KAF4588871.1 hypothetical protein EYR40_010426 [Pleurotus pulmonarius]